LDERGVCERILRERPGYKRLVGLVPAEVGITRAVMAAAVEAGCLSKKDLIIAVPTLEQLGLLSDPAVSERVAEAVKAAEDARAAHLATRVRSKAAQEILAEAAEVAVKKAVLEAQRELRIYFFVDISSSMHQAIDQAKRYLEQFLHAFPLERLHVAVFNTAGREIKLKHASAAGVRQAFAGISAGGGTDYGAGVRALRHHPPLEGEDVLFVFVGDEEAHAFASAVQESGLGPLAFGLVRLQNSPMTAVQDTAATLGIPCFLIDERTFEDAYAIPRTVRALVAATPVGQRKGAAPQKSLVEQIVETELLQKPVWADVAA
ncbi:MAG: VWA domain-containing protein, partial [Myxococcales bacterium]|nr:VWA domain-containing protein [Myxococcales bacterium]